MAQRFLHNGMSVLGIDFDPQAIQHARQAGISAYYGDASDAEFARFLPLEGTKVIVFAFQHHLTNPFAADSRASLARTLRAAGFSGRIVSTSHFRGGEERLQGHGIDTVLCPFEDAAIYGADYVMKLLDAPAGEEAAGRPGAGDGAESGRSPPLPPATQ
jgi:Trk K+ transport system NAD-binding subunit